MTKIIVFFLFSLFPITFAADFESYLKNQEAYSIQGMFENISRSDTRRGVVVASPSRHDPDYYYHWTRDSALTMDTVVLLYAKATNANDKKFYFNTLVDFINFERHLQFLPSPGGLGEPKFRVDGTIYNEPWGRPQNDGPALRVITLAKFAFILLQEGNREFVEKYLYNDDFQSMMKMDLEYTAHQWMQPSFDLWEEVYGHHFYTRIVQRKALLLGAQLASKMNDPAAAHFYLQQAELLKRALEDHWNPQYQYLMTTFDRVAGFDYKVSNLDTAQLLGVIHSNTFDQFLNPSDDRVLATLVKIVDTFKRTYGINNVAHLPGVAIGRYPEDRYYGGNPWFLTTHAISEILYLAIVNLKQANEIKINSTNLVFYKYFLGFSDIHQNSVYDHRHPRFLEILNRMLFVGDLFMKRSQYHKDSNGSMAEQYNRDNGYMLAARDLTWSYASFLTAKWARDLAITSK